MSKMTAMPMQNAKLFGLLLTLAVAGLFLWGPLRLSMAHADSSDVADADAAVRSAFNATLQAEKAGANVSDLLARLNQAGLLLTEAEIASASGNSTDASGKAGQCIGIAQTVESDATALKASALDQARTVFWTYLTFSVVSTAAFVVALVLVWRRFKRGHVRNVLGMKPEVKSNEV
jgi:hypothetical protein